MKKLLLTFATTITTIITFAQSPSFSWAKEIDTKYVVSDNSITKDAANNIYIATDKGITKYTNAGTIVWQKTIGDISVKSFGIGLDASGNVYTSGTFTGSVDFDPSVNTTSLTSFGDFDVYILKLDGTGNFIWAKNFGGSSTDNVNALSVDDTGNIYTTGIYAGTVDFDPNAGVVNLTSANGNSFVSKINTSGNLVWAKIVGYANYGSIIPKAVTVDGSGNVFTSGNFSTFIYPADFDPTVATYTFSTVGINDLFVSKLDASGNFLWAKQIATTINSSRIDCNAITADAAGNTYYTGFFNGTIDFDPSPATLTLTSGSRTTFILKLNTTGNLVWAKNFGSPTVYQNSYGSAISLDATGNVYTTGEFAVGTDFDPSAAVYSITPQPTTYNSSDSFVHKLDANGNFVWAVGMGGTSNDFGNGIVIDSDNNIFTTGYFQMAYNDFDPGLAVYALDPNIASGYVHKLGAVQVGVNELNKTQNDFSLYPNPTTEIINVKLEMISKGNSTIEIINTLGKTILSKTITENTHQLNVSDFAKGIYFVTIKSDNKTSTQKLIID